MADVCSILSSSFACARVPIPIPIHLYLYLYGCTAIPSDNLKSMPRPESATQGDKRSTGTLGHWGKWARMDLGREKLKLMGFLRRACLVLTLTAFRDFLYSYTCMCSIIRKCVLHTCTRVTQQALVPVHTVLRVKKVGGGPKFRLAALISMPARITQDEDAERDPNSLCIYTSLLQPYV